MLDGLLQMRHEHEIPSVEPIVVQGVMINVREYGSGSESIRLVVGVHVLAHFLHCLDGRDDVRWDLALKFVFFLFFVSSLFHE